MSRIEDLLNGNVPADFVPQSRVEKLLSGDFTERPQSRVEELLADSVTIDEAALNKINGEVI